MKKVEKSKGNVGRDGVVSKSGREVLHAKAVEDKFRKSLETNSSKLVVRKKHVLCFLLWPRRTVERVAG